MDRIHFMHVSSGPGLLRHIENVIDWRRNEVGPVAGVHGEDVACADYMENQDVS